LGKPGIEIEEITNMMLIVG